MSVPETQARSSDYWTLVFRQFRRRPHAVVAWWVVQVLFLVAMFAPFLASSRPLVLEEPTGWSFPALRLLGRQDACWLAGLLGAVTGRLYYWRRTRREPDRPHLLAAVMLGALVVLAGSALSFAMPDDADRVDWDAKVEAASTEGRTVVRAPIPFGPSEGLLTRRLTAPQAGGHLVGTDNVGRDVVARLVWGTRVSLIVGFIAVSIYVTIGVVIGSLAGYFGGVIDLVAQRLIEVMMCFPTIFLLLAILAFLPPSIFNIMVLIGLTGWTGVARLVRGEMLRLRNQDFVTAGVAMGASSPRLIFRHLLPNALSPVLVSATFGVAGAILVEASLSFLGFGVPPPTPSWGSLLYDARPYVSSHPWLALYPGLAIFITVTAYNLVGEGLRDALDPRLKK